MNLRSLQKLIAPLTRRVRLMVARGVVKLVYDDLKAQGIQVSLLNGEVKDKVERFQEYGFTSVPHEGSEAIMVSIGGNRDHGIIIACEDRRYRLKGLQAGEVALYTDEGDYIKLARNNIIDVVTKTLNITAETLVNIDTDTMNITATTAVNIDSPDINATGNISAAAEVSDGTRSMSEDRNIYNGHDHAGDSGGVTGAPNQEQ